MNRQRTSQRIDSEPVNEKRRIKKNKERKEEYSPSDSIMDEVGEPWDDEGWE
jgi:hypothetical protein